MPRLIGTRGNDYLEAPDGRDWVLRGRAGDDGLLGYEGVDHLYGGAGDDRLQGWADNDFLYGGAGNDFIEGGRESWGGTGDDRVGGSALAVGGKGNDFVFGGGALYGDEGPDREHRVVGNDTLTTSAVLGAPQWTTMDGGLGADSFFASAMQGDGVTQNVEIMDFQPGVDKIWAARWGGEPGADLGSSAALFDRLDANDNGVLEWSDSLSGGAVYVRPDGTMRLGLSWTYATPTGHDIEDSLFVHGTTQITAADWIMT